MQTPKQEKEVKKRMPYFKKTKFTSSDSHDKYWIFEPTAYRKGKNVVFVKNKPDRTFVKRRRK